MLAPSITYVEAVEWGVDDNAVVNAELQVRGIDGLRIADASIFPSIPSANTAAPTIMVAEKAAEYMLNSK